MPSWREDPQNSQEMRLALRRDCHRKSTLRKQYIYLGEQATWPRILTIRDRTRLSRLFGTCIGVLTRRIAAKAEATIPRRRRKQAVD